MHVITVSPIVRGSYLDELSYFSPRSYPEGSIIEVPLQKRATRKALVLESREAKNIKGEIKDAGYALKKIPSQEPLYISPDSFISSLKEIARTSATPLGSVLTRALPKVSFKYPIEKQDISGGNARFTYLQNTFEERMRQYRSIIRTSFAEDASLFILCPTKTQVEKVRKAVTKGIQAHTFVIHGSLSQKDQKERWEKALNHSQPLLLIATPQYLSFPHKKLTRVILEEEGSPHWSSFTRPFLNFRELAFTYAEKRGFTLTFSDILLRSETYKKVEEKVIESEERSTFIYPTKNHRVLDMNKFNTDEGFALFAPPAADCLEKLSEKKEKALVYVVRKGTYPLTQCEDCGAIVKCEKCDYPLVLYRKDARNVYKCHTCTITYTSDIRCQVCHGWKLTLLGIGIENVADNIRETYPDTPLFVIDNEEVRGVRDIQQVLKDFDEAQSGILLTTERGLVHNDGEVDCSIAVSLDPLFSIPDLRINERIARIVLTLRSFTKKDIFLQTRSGSIKVLEMLGSGKTKLFLEHELKERKAFHLPPYCVLVKLSWTQNATTYKKIQSIFSSYTPEIYRSFYRSQKGEEVYNALIRIERDKWPHEKLISRLSSLPPFISIDVNPESVL